MQSYPEVRFSPELVANVGEIGQVLGDFLDKQTTQIQLDLEKKFPEVSSTAVKKILSSFVTLEGTKRPLHKEHILIPKLNQQQIGFCLDRLEKARILRLEDGLFELAHDTLALRIAEDRSAAEIAFLEISKLVKDRFKVFTTTKTLLNTNELHLVLSNKARLVEEGSFTTEEWAFVNKSASENRRRRLLLAAAIFGIIIVLAGFSIYSFQQRRIAQQNQREANIAKQEAEANLLKLEQEQAQKQEAQYLQHLANGKVLMSQSDYLGAIKEFDIALEFKTDGEEALQLKSECEAKSGTKNRFEQLIAEGDALHNLGPDTYVNALEKYRSALQLGYNNSLAQSKMNTVNGKLEGAFEAFKNKGDTFFNAGGYDFAIDFYRKALRIKPNDAYIKQRITACEAKLK